MSDLRRRFVRLSIFLLPALLLLAGLHLFRGDLRDAASSLMAPRYTIDGVEVRMMGKTRREPLAAWTRDLIAILKSRDRIYGFKSPEAGFLIEVRSGPGGSECERGSNRILIRGIPDDAGLEKIQPDLSRLIARAMLREGAPDADFSPWFEEGVSRYYETVQMPVTSIGSRKDDLITEAARHPPASLTEVLSGRRVVYFDAVSHSIVAFLHGAYGLDKIAQYAKIERAPGAVPPGEFERIFHPDVEREWRAFLERR